ncbi:hypothetical protein KP509_37G043600 [Ceratopteris richardii]|uniref:Uncharacterized protein n=1 Tax=Ceratopteris richardii TaxID=49495 RepID=A0A8T2Q849_CERRI|nr:hypothetical protein KP509_37G043600 [Ceratopteris richardii]
MLHWMFSLEVGLPAAIAFIATIAILCNSYCCHHFGKHENRGCMPSGHGDIHASREERDSLHASHENKTARGIHLNAPHKDKKDDLDAALRPSKKILAVKAYSTRPFDWSDHPGLVAEAVEHGWSAFAFVYRCSTCSLSLKFWEMSKSSCKHELEPDVTWEASSDSLYMQKLWFNPGQVSTKEDCIFLFQSLQAALPLPGPPLDYLPFPQEGYYEITIVADGSMDARRSSYTENEQLDIMSRHLLSGKWRDSEATDNAKSDSKVEMQLKRNISRNSRLSEALQNLSSHGDSVFFPNKHPSKENLQTLAIGLGIGGALPLRLPGLNHGSIGFHSNGRIYLNGKSQHPLALC